MSSLPHHRKHSEHSLVTTSMWCKMIMVRGAWVGFTDVTTKDEFKYSIVRNIKLFWLQFNYFLSSTGSTSCNQTHPSAGAAALLSRLLIIFVHIVCK